MSDNELQALIEKAVEGGDPAEVEKLQSSPEGRKLTLARAKRDLHERLEDGKPISPGQVLHHLMLMVHQVGNEFALVRAERNAIRRRLEKLEERVGDLRQSSTAYRGVWREEDTPYREGELCTHKGGLWHCWSVTTDKPGSSSAWQLMSKTNGRDSR
jgi:hypothetical protein